MLLLLKKLKLTFTCSLDSREFCHEMKIYKKSALLLIEILSFSCLILPREIPVSHLEIKIYFELLGMWY